MLVTTITLNGISMENVVTPKRENKGKSLLLRINEFTAIDLETTGLSPMFDSIIELAAIRYRGGVAVETYQQLVNPGFCIDDFVTELTGITGEMLERAPSLKETLPGFIDFIGNDVLVGHNVNFDINFLYDNCVELGLPPCSNDYIDTMRIAKRMYKEWPDYRLDTMISELALDTRILHRGVNDAQLAAQGYLTMARQEFFTEAMKPVHNLKASDIIAREGYINPDSPLYGQVCVFTGTLESFTRREAMQLVTDIGGICGDNVTKKTNLLILGNNDYCKAIKGGKSNKQKKAEKLILDGASLKIIPESVFIDMLLPE